MVLVVRAGRRAAPRADRAPVTALEDRRTLAGAGRVRPFIHVACHVVDAEGALAARLCAETIGVIDWMFNTTVEYSKDRTAFGRPIGSFQSLKHIMADLGMYVEMAKAGAVAAAHAVQSRQEDAAELASMAAAFIGDVAIMVSQESLQIHGGIGYTWEHDLHLYMRRARSNSLMYGEPGWHRERVCAIHGL